MDSKTVTTIALVIVCMLLFPVAIGIVGGVFGVVGGILGGLFGIFTGLLGAIFGAIAGLFGVAFGIFGWGGADPWHGSFSFFDRDVLTAIILVVVVVLMTRPRTRHHRSDDPTAKP